MTEQMYRTGALPDRRSLGAAGRPAAGGLLLAGAAWVARAVWEVRLALAGEPASGPPDQGGGQHRPLTALEDSYHLVTALGGGAVVLCAVLFLSWLARLRDDARELSGEPPRYAGIWLYLGWIVPVVNLWFPPGDRRRRVPAHRAGAQAARLRGRVVGAVADRDGQRGGPRLRGLHGPAHRPRLHRCVAAAGE